jgi:uncharacterized MnhB-related membrane protein
MSLLEAILYAIVAVLGTAVVFTKRPLNQLMVFAAFGIALSLLFFVLHAPDVALSEITVGTLAIPLFVMIAMMKTGGGA